MNILRRSTLGTLASMGSVLSLYLGSTFLYGAVGSGTTGTGAIGVIGGVTQAAAVPGNAGQLVGYCEGGVLCAVDAGGGPAGATGATGPAGATGATGATGASQPAPTGSGPVVVVQGVTQSAALSCPVGYAYGVVDAGAGEAGVAGCVSTQGDGGSSGGGGGAVVYGAYASRAAASGTQNLFIPSAGTGIVPFVDTGSWLPLLGNMGVAGVEVAPGNDAGLFHDAGPGTMSSFSAVGGCLSFAANANPASDALVGYEQVKASIDQTLTAYLSELVTYNPSQNPNEAYAGVWVRDTTTGALEGIFLYTQNTETAVVVETYANLAATPTYKAGGYANIGVTPGAWLKITPSGTGTLTFAFSLDGVHSTNVWVDTAPFVPSLGNRYGWGADPYSTQVVLTLESWQQL